MIPRPALYKLRFVLLLLGALIRSVYSIKEILISTYDPVVSCSLNDPLNAQITHSIEVNIMRNAFTMINWTEGVDYYLNCTTWEDIFISLADYQSRPDLIGAFGGITISGDRLQAGFKFSQPTMSTGMSLLYRLVPNNISISDQSLANTWGCFSRFQSFQGSFYISLRTEGCQY